MKKSLADHLQLWGINGDVTVFSNGSLGMAFEVEPLDVSATSSAAVNELADRIITFLNSLPTGIDVQFVQDIAKGNGKRIEQHAGMLNPAASEIVRKLTQSRTKRLRNLDDLGELPNHSLHLFIRRSMSSKLLDRPKWLSFNKDFESIAEEKLVSEISTFERICSDLASNLSTLGVSSRKMSSQEVLELVYAQWNPTRPIGLKSYDPDDVRGSLLFTDVGIYENGFSLSNMHHRILSLKVLPERTFASMASALRELPFGSRLFVTFHVPDQQKEIEKLQVQRRIAYSMVAGKRTGVSDIESQAKFQDLESLLGDMVAAGEKVFRVSLNVLLKSTDQAQLDEMVSKSLQTIRALGGSDAMEETLASFDVFSELSLPNARSSERARYLKSSNLADFLPIYGPWRGHEKPRVLLRSRLGSLVKFDPFSPALTNANQVISGGSGSGKSYLTNILLMQMMKEEVRSFIIDIGGSYKKVTEHFEGQYIPLGVGSGLAIDRLGDLDYASRKDQSYRKPD